MYRSRISTCVTSVNLDGKDKSIMNKQNAPAALISFENTLTALSKASS